MKTYVPGVPVTIPPCSDDEVLDAIQLRIRLDEVQFQISTGKLDLQDASIRRSPEPAPQYDTRGVRVNTKEKIAMEKLTWERQGLVIAAQKINPQFQPPADFKFQEQKLQLKIPIPFKEYPDYNFIGLIIGPRGLTQRQMEKETNTKIAIRGKGAMKEGKQHNSGGSDEPLHVMITAQTMDGLKRAEQQIRKILTPVEEDRNEHKKAQLRKLAEINGTLKEELWDDVAGGTSGPRVRASQSCRVCGATIHQTYDCTENGNGSIGVPGMSVREYFYKEYVKFCEAIGEKPPQFNKVDDETVLSNFYEELGA